MKKTLLLIAALCAFSIPTFADNISNYRITASEDGKHIDIYRIHGIDEVLVTTYSTDSLNSVRIQSDHAYIEYTLTLGYGRLWNIAYSLIWGLGYIPAGDMEHTLKLKKLASKDVDFSKYDGDVFIVLKKESGVEKSEKITGKSPTIHDIPEELFIENIVSRIENPGNLALTSKKMKAAFEKSNLSLKINYAISFNALIEKLNECSEENLTRVKTLSFGNRYVKKFTTDQILTILDSFPNLESLDVQFTDITYKEVTAIAEKLPNLRSLDLSIPLNTRERSFMPIGTKCPNLTSLNLSWPQKIKDKEPKARKEKYKHLTSLDISEYSKITDKGLIELAINCPLTSLDLPRCYNITDTILKALATNCPHLEYLSVSNCSKITINGVRELESALPHCKIYSNTRRSRFDLPRY